MLRSICENHLIEPQRFTHRPCLEWTAAWRMRCFAIGDFGDVAQAVIFKMFEERLEIFAAGLLNASGRVLVNRYPRIDESPDKPRPDRALVIGAVSVAHSALIARRITGFSRRE